MISMLYSPVNFYVGVKVTLQSRSKLTLAQAVREAETEAPNWGWKLAAAVVGGCLALAGFVAVLHYFAGPSMSWAVSHITTKRLVSAVGGALVLTAEIVAVRACIRGARYYAAMCRVGRDARRCGR